MPFTTLISACILLLSTSSFSSLFWAFSISLHICLFQFFYLSHSSHLFQVICHFFSLGLSLHTIANNLVRESHLCSCALSINSPFFLSLFMWLVIVNIYLFPLTISLVYVYMKNYCDHNICCIILSQTHTCVYIFTATVGSCQSAVRTGKLTPQQGEVLCNIYTEILF